MSLPGGVFTQAGAGVKTNLLFFTKGGPTKSVWYYDLSDIKVGKKTPFTRDRFDDFFRLPQTEAQTGQTGQADPTGGGRSPSAGETRQAGKTG